MSDCLTNEVPPPKLKDPSSLPIGYLAPTPSPKSDPIGYCWP
jgi:hypothetical protein